MATIVGIDPGLGGGIAVLGAEKDCALPFSTMSETEEFLIDLVKSEGSSLLKAFVEDPPVFFQGAGGGLASQAKLHRNLGQYEGLLMGLGIPFEAVQPKKWQKGLPGLAKLKGVERKRALKNLAVQRYPQLKPTLKTCDAILIAEYGLKNSQ